MHLSALRSFAKQPSLLGMIIVLTALFIVSPSIGAETMVVGAPYLGAITNSHQDKANSLDLNDTRLMEGLFFQAIDPASGQVNAFLYHAADLNYSQLWGGHLQGDLYLGPVDRGAFVIGAGFERMYMDMDAGDNFTGIKDFTLKTAITQEYLRTGKYFLLDAGPLRVSVLPWVGVLSSWVNTELAMNVVTGPSKTMAISRTTPTWDPYAFQGINAKFTLFHAITLEGKYQVAFNDKSYLQTVSANADVFFTRRYGLTYRFKYMQETSGSTYYHLLGLAVAF